MPKDRKRALIQYRKLDDPQRYFGQMSLQDAICQALSAERNGGPMRDLAERRWQGDDPAYGTVVLNEIREPKEFVFGELVRFEEGAQLTLVHRDKGVASYNLLNAPAPDGHEGLKGTLYFMVIGNHVTLLPGEMASNRLESYLTWLVHQGLSDISKAAAVVLNPLISIQSVGTGMPSVQSVTITPPAVGKAKLKQAEWDDFGESASRRVLDLEGQGLFSLLRAVGVGDVDLQRALDTEAEVKVTLRIDFKDGRRNRPISADTVNRMFRNVDTDEITFRDSRGAVIKGGMMKLSYAAEVLTVGSLLSAKDVARALEEAYRHFVDNGHIEP